MVRPLQWITLSALVVGGVYAVTTLVIPAAGLALMLETVVGRAYRLRRAQAEPLSAKATTYLVMGGMGWVLAAWLAYMAGALLRAMA